MVSTLDFVPTLVDTDTDTSIRLEARSRPSLNWSTAGSVRPDGPGQRDRRLSKRHLIKADLVAVRGEGADERPTVKVPLVFDSRTMVGQLVTISGSDASGTLRARFSVTPTGSGRINITLDPPDDARPKDILRVLRLMTELADGASIGMWLHATGGWASPPVPAADVPPIPEDYFRAVEAVARIQASTGVAFPMPNEIDGATAANINRALVLLAGGEVTRRWNHSSIVLSRLDVQDAGFVEGARFQIETDIDYSIEIDGHHLDLGVVQAQFVNAQVTAIEDSDENNGDLRVAFVPGDEETVTITLVARSHFDPFERLDAGVIRIGSPRHGGGLGSLVDQ